MNPKNKEFWLQVKKEYNPKESDLYHGICFHSKTFLNAWKNPLQKPIIVELAKLFLLDLNEPNFFIRQDNVLFGNHWMTHKKNFIEIRQLFINSIIKIFS